MYRKKDFLRVTLVPLPHSLSLGDGFMLPKVPNLAEKVVVGRENGQHIKLDYCLCLNPLGMKRKLHDDTNPPTLLYMWYSSLFYDTL
jgi:hypothetical protein